MDAKEAAALADEYKRLRDIRLEKDKEAERAKQAENTAKQALLDWMKEKQVHMIGGKVAVVTRTTSTVATALDWEKIYEYIKEHDAFDLLYRRLTDAACKVRWEDGVEIPGVAKFEVDKLGVANVKK